jgi:hypothetical protein
MVAHVRSASGQSQQPGATRDGLEYRGGSIVGVALVSSRTQTYANLRIPNHNMAFAACLSLAAVASGLAFFAANLASAARLAHAHLLS